MSVPQYKDISKAASDILDKDFYHLSPLSLDVKTHAPNGVQFSVNGKSSRKDGTLAGNLQAEYTDKLSGVKLTQGWSSANVLSTKIELSEAFTPGLKGELDTTFKPESAAKTAKVGLTYKQPGISARVLADVLKGPVTGDITLGHGGFLGGAEIAYDLTSGKIRKYSTTVGFVAPSYLAAVQATDNLSVFSALIFNRVNPATEIGARATWDSKSPSSDDVGLEAGVKHALDPSAFVKAKLNNQGVASLAYSQALRPGVTLGIGLLADTQRLNESAHKIGLSLKFTA